LRPLARKLRGAGLAYVFSEAAFYLIELTAGVAEGLIVVDMLMDDSHSRIIAIVE